MYIYTYIYEYIYISVGANRTTPRQEHRPGGSRQTGDVYVGTRRRGSSAVGVRCLLRNRPVKAAFTRTAAAIARWPRPFARQLRTV